jgi:hypothetical protein
MPLEQDNDTGVAWICGEFTTVAARIGTPLMAAIWCIAWLSGAPLKPRRMPDSDWFRLIVAAGLAGWAYWNWAHIKWVGYRGKNLVIASFRRQIEVPFSDVEAVETVPWSKGKAVRVRFLVPNAFGRDVCYAAKWKFFRGYNEAEEELVNLLRQDTNFHRKG